MCSKHDGKLLCKSSAALLLHAMAVNTLAIRARIAYIIGLCIDVSPLGQQQLYIRPMTNHCIVQKCVALQQELCQMLWC